MGKYFKELSCEEKQLIGMMNNLSKSFDNIRREFFKDIGRLDSSAYFKALAEKHCTLLMSLVYKTIENDYKRKRQD